MTNSKLSVRMRRIEVPNSCSFCDSLCFLSRCHFFLLALEMRVNDLRFKAADTDSCDYTNSGFHGWAALTVFEDVDGAFNCSKAQSACSRMMGSSCSRRRSSQGKNRVSPELPITTHRLRSQP